MFTAFWAKIVAFIMSILVFFGLAVEEQPLTEGISADGNKLEITMTANPSTGYDWTYTIDGDSVEYADRVYAATPGTENMVGSGGTYTYYFTAVEPGTSEITFIYSRSWDVASVERTITYTVTVNDALEFVIE